VFVLLLLAFALGRRKLPRQGGFERLFEFIHMSFVAANALEFIPSP
jgi:hypothetical protein